jgi:hypothetical protein
MLIPITAPRYGDITGPVTGLLDEDDLAVVHAHEGKHACFSKRFVLGLMHRATDYQCIPDQCPQLTDERPKLSLGTRRLRSEDNDEVSLMFTRRDSNRLILLTTRPYRHGPDPGTTHSCVYQS